MKIFPVYYFCIDELYFVTYLIKQPCMYTFKFLMYKRVTLTITYPEGPQGMSLIQWHKVFYSNYKSNNVATYLVKQQCTRPTAVHSIHMHNMQVYFTFGIGVSLKHLGAFSKEFPQTPMHHLLEVFENTVKLDNICFLCHG